MGAIDDYVVGLDGALRGSRRVKSDLITEARDSLVDAADAYRLRGIAAPEAERRAVQEFGAVHELAPAYQAIVGLRQARRTAMLVFLVLLAQPVVWAHAGGARGNSWYVFLQGLVDWLGGATLVASLVAMLACGMGVRYLGARLEMARYTGVFALVVSVVFATTGALLTALSPRTGSLFVLTGAPRTVVFLMIPLTVVFLSARRCLHAARG